MSQTPIISGSNGSGIFSVSFSDQSNGVIVGGDYQKPDQNENILAFTKDGGKNWDSAKGLTGYRSSVAFISPLSIIAVGTTGIDLTQDGGKTWRKIGNENLNAVAARGPRAIWAVGPAGMVVKLNL